MVVGGFALKIVEDGLRGVAARLWLSVDVVVDGGFEGVLVVVMMALEILAFSFR